MVWIGLVFPLLLLGFLMAMHVVEQRVFPVVEPGAAETSPPIPARSREIGLAPAQQGGDLLGLDLASEAVPLISAQ